MWRCDEGILGGVFAHAISLKLSEMKNRWQICSLLGHLDSVRSVGLSPDGKLVVSGSQDGIEKIWNAETGAEVSNFVGVC